MVRDRAQAIMSLSPKNARIAVRAFGGLEQDVVIGVRIERRVEIDQINALVRDMLAQDVEIVPEIELVGHASSPFSWR